METIIAALLSVDISGGLIILIVLIKVSFRLPTKRDDEPSLLPPLGRILCPAVAGLKVRYIQGQRAEARCKHSRVSFQLE